MIDIIIPVLNEEKILREKKDYFLSLKKEAQLIFVDGGSSDQTTAVAKSLGTVLQSDRGRGVQKNVGAQFGLNPFILFLHVDTSVSLDQIRLIPFILKECAGGCFRLSIDDSKIIFRVYESIVNFRARFFSVIDGDLGMFVRRDVFKRLGGFERLIYLEDILFGKKLRKEGRVYFVNQPISASSRKWHEKGFLKTFFLYTIAYLRLWTNDLGPIEVPFKRGSNEKSTHHLCQRTEKRQS